MQSLNNSEADAAEIACLLRSIDGFQVVSLIDLTSAELKAAVDNFINLIDEGVIAVFYFCGHGFEAESENYLIPIDAEELGDGPGVCIRAQEIHARMQMKNARLSFLILDACRVK